VLLTPVMHLDNSKFRGGGGEMSHEKELEVKNFVKLSL
jgi:hypothetical protein